MPHQSEAIQQAAQALALARTNRRPIPPVSTSHGIASLDAAYAVAEINTRIRLESGRRIVGLKVGLTSKAVQQQLGRGPARFWRAFRRHGISQRAGRADRQTAAAEG